MLNRVLPVLWRIGQKVSPEVRIDVVKDDPDDDRVLECAVEARADYIVSGDRHLLALESYEAIRIVSPRQFVQLHPE
jgi:predicted nucleic acid-binding protein